MSDKLHFVESLRKRLIAKALDKLKFVGHRRLAFLLGFLDNNILWPPTAIPKEPEFLRRRLSCRSLFHSLVDQFTHLVSQALAAGEEVPDHRVRRRGGIANDALGQTKAVNRARVRVVFGRRASDDVG